MASGKGTERMQLLSVVLILFLGASLNNIPALVFSSLYIVGVWKLFEKSNIRGWWALIPGAREYQLGRCAGREPEGRVYMVVRLASTVLSAASPFIHSESVVLLLFVFLIILGISDIVYTIRVWAGIVQVYGVKRRWLWLVLTDYTAWIPAVVWGFSKKYQPSWKVEDLQAEMAKLASHGSATLMDEGLSVDLNRRTVTEFFHRNVLLRDIHMNIPCGHMVLLLGGSGAGKTTYLNAVNGYEKADATVLLNGTDLYRNYKKMQYEVGFVPQSEMMRGKDTVFNTLMDAARLRLPVEISAEQRRARVNEVMDIFGLQSVKNSLVEKLSGGQKKRLSISIEFLSNPSLFILDEPDSGLDGVMARELFEQLRIIADTGKIVIVITHTPDRVIDLFDDVIVLAKDSAHTGRLAYYGSIDGAREFFGRDSMEKIVKSVNSPEEGGDGQADDFVLKYMEVQHG